MVNLQWLQDWYAHQCNGDWEHQYGIKIDTLDNPGWTIRIDLVGTRFADLAMSKAVEDKTDSDWLRCWIEDGAFRAVCGPRNLSEVLEVFRKLIEQH